MRRRRSHLGCLFWLALALLVVVLFLYNRERINRVLSAVRLFPAGEAPEVVVHKEPKESQPDAANRTAPPEVVIRVPAPPVTEPPTGQPESAVTTASEGQGVARTRKARIFFVRVAENGDISLHGVLRSVPYTDSPLRETLLALLGGQAASDLTNGLLTMIPSGVELRNVYVRDGTAYVDLSERFRINPLGRAGLEAQLKQLVYTATEFPTVSSVQLLIEGRKIDYLSPEGPYVGRPLSRDDLIKGTQ